MIALAFACRILMAILLAPRSGSGRWRVAGVCRQERLPRPWAFKTTHSTNQIERIRRRTDVVGILPKDDEVIRLI